MTEHSPPKAQGETGMTLNDFTKVHFIDNRTKKQGSLESLFVQRGKFLWLMCLALHCLNVLTYLTYQ